MIVILPVLPIEEDAYNKMFVDEVIPKVKAKIEAVWKEEVRVINSYTISMESNKFRSLIL
jgi:hypothetical protein